MEKEVSVNYSKEKITVKFHNMEELEKNKKHVKNFLSLFCEKLYSGEMEAMGEHLDYPPVSFYPDRRREDPGCIGINYKEFVDRGLCNNKQEAIESAEAGIHALMECMIIVERNRGDIAITCDSRIIFEMYLYSEWFAISHSICNERSDYVSINEKMIALEIIRRELESLGG